MASEQTVNRLPDRARNQRLTELGNWAACSVVWAAIISMCGAVVWVLLYTPAH